MIHLFQVSNLSTTKNKLQHKIEVIVIKECILYNLDVTINWDHKYKPTLLS